MLAIRPLSLSKTGSDQYTSLEATAQIQNLINRELHCPSEQIIMLNMYFQGKICSCTFPDSFEKLCIT